MKTIGIRALCENPGILNQCANAGEYVLLTNHNQPMSLSVPFNRALIDNGVHVNLAIGLFEQGTVTLVKAAKIAKLSVQDFLEHLSLYGVVVVDQSADELSHDLGVLGIE